MPSEPSQPGLLFLLKARAYPCGAPHRRRYLALPINFRPGQIGLPVTKPLAYLSSLPVIKKKRFITWIPEVNLIKLFWQKFTHSLL